MMRRYLAIAAASAALVFAAFLFARESYPATDFTIFYCAGNALDHGGNAYTTTDVIACEHRYWSPSYLAGFAEPAATPGYVLPLFSVLAMLPFDVAKLLWLFASAIFFGIAVAAGVRLSKLPPVAVFALLAVPVAVLNIGVGQLGPFIVAPLFVGAALLRGGHPRAAALVTMASAIEPHVALPAAVALLVLVPRARAIVLSVGTLLVAVHIAVLGPHGAATYFTQVLPAMSRSEMFAADQYGTFAALVQAGVGAAPAQKLSITVYLLGIGAGIFLACTHVRRYRDGAMIVAIPVAVSLLSAPFLHDVELCAALVAPLAAFATSPHDRRWIAAAIVLAIPWYAAIHSAGFAVKGIGGAALFAAFSLERRLVADVGGAVVTCMFAAAVFLLIRHLPVSIPHLTSVTVGTQTLAAQSWAQHFVADPALAASGMRIVAAKALAWCGLLAIAILAVSRRSDITA